MEFYLQALSHVQNLTIYHIIALVIIMIYSIARMIFKFKMKDYPKEIGSDGSKKYR